MPEEKDSITDVHKVFGDDRQPTQKAKVCYARVSSEHQRDDLERQITDLRQRYPGHEIISDIGLGSIGTQGFCYSYPFGTNIL